jgi:hypothetical protein
VIVASGPVMMTVVKPLLTSIYPVGDGSVLVANANANRTWKYLIRSQWNRTITNASQTEQESMLQVIIPMTEDVG